MALYNPSATFRRPLSRRVVLGAGKVASTGHASCVQFSTGAGSVRRIISHRALPESRPGSPQLLERAPTGKLPWKPWLRTACGAVVPLRAWSAWPVLDVHRHEEPPDDCRGQDGIRHELIEVSCGEHRGHGGQAHGIKEQAVVVRVVEERQRDLRADHGKGRQKKERLSMLSWDGRKEVQDDQIVAGSCAGSRRVDCRMGAMPN